jgi:hypothetical protein
MALLNWTTKIDPDKTAAEIARCLSMHGAQAVLTEAVRVAWRIVKDWVEAQMALVETQMVSTQDVFLPYAVMGDGKTLAEHVRESPRFLLGSGTE